MSRQPEDQHLARQARPPRRPCVCRGYIEPDGPGEAAIARAVDSHDDTNEHLAWRYRGLMAGELVIPEPPVERVRRYYTTPVPTVRRVPTDPELVPAGRRAGWDGEL